VPVVIVVIEAAIEKIVFKGIIEIIEEVIVVVLNLVVFK
jgi:hypothetical protein